MTHDGKCCTHDPNGDILAEMTSKSVSGGCSIILLGLLLVIVTAFRSDDRAESLPAPQHAEEELP